MAYAIKPSGPAQAKILIIGDFPGADDVIKGEPFQGTSGWELGKMLHEAGVLRTECRLTNLLPFRPESGSAEEFFDFKNKRPIGTTIPQAIIELEKEVRSCKPNIIILLGGLPLYAAISDSAISTWRGSLLTFCGVKAIPTYHPSQILRNWEWRAIAIHDLQRAQRESESAEQHDVPYDFIIRPQASRVMSTLQKLIADVNAAPTKLSVDIETRAGHTACTGIAWSKTEAICIPHMCVEDNNGFYSAEDEAAIILTMRELLTHPNARVVGQNFLYDAQYFAKHWGFVPNLTDDTMFQQNIAFPGLPKGLDFLASMYAEHYTYWKGEGKLWDPRIPEEQLWVYNCKDACYTYEIHTVLEAANIATGKDSIYRFQMKLWWAVLRMMLRGVRIDLNYRKQLSGELLAEISKRETWLQSVCSHPLNPRSPKQMQNFFYEDLRLPVQRQSKGTRSVTTDDEALIKLAVLEPIVAPVCNTVRELRSLGVFHSTFVCAGLGEDFRMRCSFNPAGTETYRFNSSKDAFDSGCLPPEAEVLTQFGWLHIDKVIRGDTIMAWQPNGNLLWQKAEPFSKECLSEKMLICEGDQVFQQLTLGHRVPHFNKRGEFAEGAAKQIAKTRVQLPLAGNYSGYGFNPEYPKLFTAALADGSYEGNAVRFQFLKTRKIQRLLELFVEYGIEYTEQSAKEGYRRFQCRRPTSWPLEKTWGLWVLYTRQSVLAEMVYEARFWDGHIRKDSFQFFSTNFETARWFQTAAHLCNSATTLRESINTSESYSPGLRIYTVNVKPRNKAWVEPKHWREIPYKGIVYCVSVPSTYFLCRLHNHIFITGNTNLQNVPKGDEEEAHATTKLVLPNIRKLFIPDPNHLIFDVDLAGADAQVVAWEANDEVLKEIFRSGQKVHAVNSKDIFGGDAGADGKREPYYSRAKAGCHLTNYGGKARTLSIALGITIREAEAFQRRWFDIHPGIADWHNRILNDLQTTRSVRNRFGYTRFYFDRIDGILPQALAWIPQSTVACVTNRHLLNIDSQIPAVALLLQVHDSLVGQVHQSDWYQTKPKLHSALEVVIPYDDPLIIRSGLKTSKRSWGHVEDERWGED